MTLKVTESGFANALVAIRVGIDEEEVGELVERLIAEAVTTPGPTPGRGDEAATTVPLTRGLSLKLLVLTIIFVLIAEILIFLPSVANFKLRWLEERRPDVVCLQELKAPQEKFPEKAIRDLGYDAQPLSQEDQLSLPLTITPSQPKKRSTRTDPNKAKEKPAAIIPEGEAFPSHARRDRGRRKTEG